MRNGIRHSNHRQVEDRLNHLNGVLRAIRNVNQLITQETDRDRLLQRACDNLVETRGYFNAWVALRDGTGRLVSAAATGPNEKFSGMVSRFEQGWLPPCGSKALAAGQAVIIKNPHVECPDCPQALSYEGTSALSTPLQFKDKIYGIMTVSIPARYLDDPEELALFEEVAGDIAFALHKIELETERQQAEAALRQDHAEMEHRVEERTAALAQANQRLKQEIEERKRVERELRESEERLALAIASIRGAMWDSLLDPGITDFDDLPDDTYLSPAEKALLGYEPNESLPHSQAAWERHVLPGDLAGMRARQRAHFEGRTARLDHEYRIRRKDGAIRWIHGRSQIIRDQAGRPLRWIGIDWDVTERKQAEEELALYRHQLETLVAERTAELTETNQTLLAEIAERERVEVALRESEARYRALFEQANDAIFLTNKYDQIIDVNQRACDLLGYSRAELQAMNISDIQAPEVRGEAGTIIISEIETYCGLLFETTDLHRDGSRIPVEVMTSKVSGQQDELFVSITRDITERKKAEAEIRRRNRELILLNRVIAATAGAVRPTTILETACRELALTFDLPQAAAALLNEEKSAASIVAEYRRKGRPSALNTTIPVVDNPALQYLLARKTPLFIDDAQGDPRLAPVKAIIRQRGIVSMLILPLTISDEVVGTLSLDAIEPRHFSSEEVELAQNVASQIGGALARARLEDERRRFEEQYHQAQKMESLGRLTGGVAHDFNNLLTAINGFAELMQMHLPPDDPQQQLTSSILRSGQRAADLVRQLLAFSRKQIIEPKILNINTVVADMDKMLQRVIGEDITLKTILDPNLGSIKIDPTQLDQIVVNLAVNARDAMPTGGCLTIETANVTLDDAYSVTHLEAQAGRHVLLAISDTGLGINEKDLPNIFEPFFTTKELNRGTGLGLATVYGIVKQNGGNVQVYSEERVGTTFKIYLPCVDQSAPDRTQLGIETKLLTGTETILVVEDDANLRHLIRQVLLNLGYTILDAPDGEKALQRVAEPHGRVDLLLTDVVMPGMSGKGLAEKLAQIQPDLKILFMSGYTENAIAHHSVLVPGVAFLQKPFSLTTLAARIREVLAR